MGRFYKMNRDIYALAEAMLKNQELCKLIYYSGQHPLKQPDIDGVRQLLNKRVLPFRTKMPTPLEEKTYVMIRPENIRSSRGGNLIKSQLVFDIYTSEKDKIVYDKNNKLCNREMLIMDKIDGFMTSMEFSIGENDFTMAGTIETRNADFTGYSIIYNDVDFRKMSE